MEQMSKDEIREITMGTQSIPTQNDQILWFMKHRGMITPLDAINEFGCMRLSARISDLTKKGYAIIHTPVTVKNRYGKKIKVMGYSLVS